MAGVVTALLLSALVAGAMVLVGPRLGFVDTPDGYLKPHEAPAVPLGGVAIVVATHVGLAAEGLFDIGLLVASGMVFLLGLVDDRVGLSPAVRLVVEVGAGIALVGLADLPALPGGVRGYVLGVVLVVVTVNAVNLLDGLDALAGSAGFVTAIGIGTLAVVRGLDVSPGLVVAAAVGGFLVWNWPPARVFLGDNGAYTMAVFLVWAMAAASPPGTEIDVAVAAALLGVFVVDLAVTLLRRRFAGRPMFAGDRSHVYDQLVDQGMSVTRVALVAAGAQAVICAVVIAVDSQLSSVMALATLALLFLLLLLVLARLGFISSG